MILHIPHSSTDTLGKKFECDIDLELSRLTDWYTDELYECDDAKRLVFPISRLICDVERFEDDSLEPMSQKGMGVCYTKNSHGDTLRAISEHEKADIIQRYYRAHHDRLEKLVDEELCYGDRALIVDCHSFSSTPLYHEDDKTMPRPDICLGADRFHTDIELLDAFVSSFSSLGYRVKINSPFSGTIVPQKYYHKDNRVQSIMIELNRSLYMDESLVKKSNFDDLRCEISDILNKRKDG